MLDHRTMSHRLIFLVGRLHNNFATDKYSPKTIWPSPILIDENSLKHGAIRLVATDRPITGRCLTWFSCPLAYLPKSSNGPFDPQSILDRLLVSASRHGKNSKCLNIDRPTTDIPNCLSMVGECSWVARRTLNHLRRQNITYKMYIGLILPLVYSSLLHLQTAISRH